MPERPGSPGSLDERFRELDRERPPDLWPDILIREPHGRADGAPWRRLAVAVLAFVVAAAGIGFALHSLLGVRRPAPATSPRPIVPKANGKIAFLGGDMPASFLGRSNIYLISADGKGLTQVTHEDFDHVNVAWSPDGTKLAFVRTSGEEGPDNIFVVNADGTGLRQLTEGSADRDIEPSWSPDGRWIAFSSKRDENYRVYVMNADGTDVVALTSGRGEFGDSSPAWSPDGTRIAFNHDSDVYVMDANGSDVRRLTVCPPFPACGVKGYPAWSPDGTKIAFIYDLDPHREIRVIDIDGTGERTLFDCSPQCLGVALSPVAWSPDGTKIAFTEISPEGKTERHLFVMNSDGTNPTRIDTGRLEACCPSWQAHAKVNP